MLAGRARRSLKDSTDTLARWVLAGPVLTIFWLGIALVCHGRDARAINFVKGCYLGQETVARIDALGHVNKTLVGGDPRLPPRREQARADRTPRPCWMYVEDPPAEGARDDPECKRQRTDRPRRALVEAAITVEQRHDPVRDHDREPERGAVHHGETGGPITGG